MKNIVEKIKRIDRAEWNRIYKYVSFGLWLVIVIFSFWHFVVDHEHIRQPDGWLSLEREEMRNWIVCCIIAPYFIALVRDVLCAVIDDDYMADNRIPLYIRFKTISLITAPFRLLMKCLLIDRLLATKKQRDALLAEQKKGGVYTSA